MSKTDQLRRQREAHFAQQEEQASKNAGKVAPVVTPPLEPTPVLVATRAKTSADAEEGKCAVCGKVRALSSGLMPNHQKGLGKMCAGSRKAPV